MAKEAARFNEGKPRLSYFRRSFQKMVEGIAWVKTFGANKYEEDNWRSGGKPDAEYWDSMDRHIDYFLNGEVYDQDSGCHHLAHACWNLCALLELNYPDVPMRDKEIYDRQMTFWSEKKSGAPHKPAKFGAFMQIQSAAVDTLDMTVTYFSANEAAKITGLSKTEILNCCNSLEKRVYGGLVWSFTGKESK